MVSQLFKVPALKRKKKKIVEGNHFETLKNLYFVASFVGLFILFFSSKI